MPMFLNVLFLIIGMFLLIKGADWFVDGASDVAKALKIPSLIIGLTLVSIGTSLPEASVSAIGSLSGKNDIALGNIMGSNICNSLLILGLSAIFMPMVVDKDMKMFHIPILILLSALLILFCFVITPNVIDLMEGIIFILLFVGYLVFLVFRTKSTQPMLDQSEEKEDEKKRPMWLSIIFVIIGIVGIVFGGEFVVKTASFIAIELGMSEILVGLTIVAVGTSLPELVTSVIASIKKEDDIAIGNVIGSNIFNIVFILGISSALSPIVVAPESIIDMLIMTAIVILIFAFVLLSKKMSRWHGISLVLLYVAYVVYIIIRN